MSTATPRPPAPMDLRKIAKAGKVRERALALAEQETDRIADELLAAGERANLNLAATLSGISRTTLYRRMRARRETR